jgi:hypothetical protein
VAVDHRLVCSQGKHERRRGCRKQQEMLRAKGLTTGQDGATEVGIWRCFIHVYGSQPVMYLPWCCVVSLELLLLLFLDHTFILIDQVDYRKLRAHWTSTVVFAVYA